MRRWNAWISIIILALFVIHCVLGVMVMTSVMPAGTAVMSAISHTMLVLIAVHIAFGVKLTVDSVRVSFKTGTSYFKENLSFWTRRISGAAIFVLVLFHLFTFMWTGIGFFSQNGFAVPQLVASILLVASVAVHVATNIKPLMISIGTGTPRKFVCTILFVTAFVALICVVAFVIYFIRG